MAERKLLKCDSAGIREFSVTDTVPASAMPSQSVISPSPITSDQDNYSPTGWADADVVRLDFDTSGRGITGFAAWTNTRPKKLINTTGNFAYIPCLHPDSSAANRVFGALDHIIEPYGVVEIEYDDTSDIIRVSFNSFTPQSYYFRGVFHSVCPGATLGGDWGTVGFGISGGNNAAVNPTSALPGSWEINTSTSATGASSLYLPKGVNLPARYGTGHLISIAYVYFPTLSDGTQTYTFSHGLTASNNGTTLNPVNSVVIRYTHGTNSGKFEGVCIGSGGTEAAVDLGITVAANTTYVLTVCVDGAGTEARFYINGVYVGRQTSQMPAAVATGDRTIIVKSAGTTSRGACIANKTFLAIF